ncbi:hypothetical protein KC356_g288 [Hortaea werneckii]|nr:hypothetical protein KC356_g288 [Hortaea werneckii]
MPLSSEALSSNTASLYASPRSWRARQRTEVVFPIPGMPLMMTCGMLPSFAMIFKRSTVSVFPTISSRKIGRYFSTLQLGQCRSCSASIERDESKVKAREADTRSRGAFVLDIPHAAQHPTS